MELTQALKGAMGSLRSTKKANCSSDISMSLTPKVDSLGPKGADVIEAHGNNVGFQKLISAQWGSKVVKFSCVGLKEY